MTDTNDMNKDTGPVKLDAATQEGLNELVAKMAPLLQGRRFHNVVDVLSWISDMVDLADENLVNKLAANYEQAISGLWAVGNAARFAANEAERDELPSRLGLWREMKDEDVRRGLYLLLRFAAVFGRQNRPD